VLGVDADKAKDKEGKALIQLFCKERPKNSKIRRATSKTHPEEWRRFVSYAGSDISAMREIYRKMPRWNLTHSEIKLWQLDQRINRRGMCMDIDLAESALAAVDAEQKRLANRTQVMTDGDVQAATQRDALLKHIVESYGVELPDMQKSTLERRIADPDLPAAVKELLHIRLQASTTSTSKYKTLLKSVSSDGRLRGTKQFCGAGRTGRWAGRLFQPDNLPRPSLKQDQIDEGIEALKAGCADLLFDNIMELTSSALRGCIMAPEGKKLVVSDLSNIEGRKLAWLAGEQWKLDAFRDYDTLILDQNGAPIWDAAVNDFKRRGPDLYKLAYARAFNISPDDVDKYQR
ncbi:DNA polymerase, partial [Salmonella enterica]|nr:DNA polymerase [Salmonella enterica]EDC5746068.1 DNA polymerase [Salmonella enterica]EDK0283610.1 DNA polymerase [Salmonella enterica]EGB4263554.1 DNA polymerase [Salmonella enterica]EGC7904223.1 DNA polymerase [Salmonella enterica]